MPRCCRKHLYHYASFRCLITSSNLKMMTASDAAAGQLNRVPCGSKETSACTATTLGAREGT